MKIGIIGSGFAGAVLAKELSKVNKFDITVFEERDHIAGNCYTARDKSTKIMVHEYGPHIFNTDRLDVWNYVKSFSEFYEYKNRTKAVTSDGIFTLPINLLTINQVFGTFFRPDEAKEFISRLGVSSIETPENFEEQALKFIGEKLYKLFFYGYTKKQWGVEPRELPASILKRLPVRFNYDDNYYSTRYQGIPVDGYTSIIGKLLDDKSISVYLGEKFDLKFRKEFDHIFYSGPIDRFFEYKEARLSYRSLTFERYEDNGDYQGNPIINYCSESIPFTRITEHKHFTPLESFDKTIYFKEFSKLASPDDTPYYPLRLVKDKNSLDKYIKLAKKEKGVTFIGRLGTYRYLNMDNVIGESLDLAKICLSKHINEWPVMTPVIY